VQQLAKRTLGGRRESGAYLLGRPRSDGSKDILEFVFYDDIDEEALATGIVTIRQTRCRAFGSLPCARYGVVADVQFILMATAKANPIRQTPSCRAPAISRLSCRNSAREPEAGSIGMYEFLGNETWTSIAQGRSLLPA